jgi:hypothetical protein
VTVVGTRAVAQGGGTGISIVNTGQGIGMTSSASIGLAEIEFGEGVANEAITQVGQVLEQLAAAAKEGDKTRFAQLYGSIKEGAMAPAVLLSFVEAVGRLAGFFA